MNVHRKFSCGEVDFVRRADGRIGFSRQMSVANADTGQDELSRKLQDRYVTCKT